jgi:hypothetical protein
MVIAVSSVVESPVHKMQRVAMQNGYAMLFLCAFNVQHLLITDHHSRTISPKDILLRQMSAHATA